MPETWAVVQRNSKWVPGAVISESVLGDTMQRRFTATVRGWRNFRIWEGDVRELDVQQVIAKVREIRDRIDAGDESVFKESTLIGGE